MSIDVSGLTKTFGDFVALDDVTVSLPTGQLTALLGPSGGGKSTLLRIIAGLDTADTGTVSIEGVNKKFGDFVALDDVNVSLPTGQLTALLGPSGGGKSTLLRIIAGLDSADSGTISIEGTNATELPPQKRNVGFVFQHYAAFKHLSVARNVAFGLEIRKRPKEEIRAKVAELLHLVHLDQFADRLPSQDRKSVV